MFGGKGFREPQMVRIRRGRYLMGSKPGEKDNELPWRRREHPQHEVRICYDFEVGKYPVTFAEWDAAAAEGACGGYRPFDGRSDTRQRFGRGKRPVINVSWDDAQQYIEWLKERTGKAYRLLSESEWEYCCRAGTTTPYSFGETLDSWRHANYANRKTFPVHSFPPNPFGLVGMHGNVWEWCEDCWNEDYSPPGRPDDGSAWLSGDCRIRVVRGGSWLNVAGLLRSAFRSRFEATVRDFNVGFRLARTL